MNPVALYRSATGRAVEVAEGVRPEQLGLATPCSEWDVQALLDHLVGGTEYLLAAMDGRAPEPPTGATAADYRDGVDAVVKGLGEPGAMERTCMSPLGFEWPVGQAVAGTFMDVLVHTWDLASATGQDTDLDPALVEACLAMFFPEMPERGREAGLVGPEVEVAPRVPPGSDARRDGTNSMTEPAVPAVEDAIRALAHPGRRAMLCLVWDEERAASDLADAAGLSRSAASQHLKLLREAGLVRVRVDATRRLYRADLERVAEVASLLDDFWATPLERFKALAEQRGRRPGASGS